MAKRVPIKVMLDQELVDRLMVAAEKYGRRTHNQVAEEVVTMLLPLWEEAEEARQKVISRQSESLAKEPSHRARKTG